jgi:hypothetical protein
VLVNEMTINDPVMYADKDYRVTTIYRRLEKQVMLEDGCTPGRVDEGPRGSRCREEGLISQIEQRILKRLPELSF